MEIYLISGNFLFIFTYAGGVHSQLVKYLKKFLKTDAFDSDVPCDVWGLSENSRDTFFFGKKI